MALTVEHPEADRLARELAAATGEPLEEAVVTALRERLERRSPMGAEERGRRLESIREIQERVRRYPVQDRRPVDELLGYEEDGLPH